MLRTNRERQVESDAGMRARIEDNAHADDRALTRLSLEHVEGSRLDEIARALEIEPRRCWFLPPAPPQAAGAPGEVSRSARAAGQ
jgi:hypothetical protein